MLYPLGTEGCREAGRGKVVDEIDCKRFNGGGLVDKMGAKVGPWVGCTQGRSG